MASKVPSVAMSQSVERMISKIEAEDRREQRRSARLRCRARELREMAEEALASGLSFIEDDGTFGKAIMAQATLRTLAPLELGLMYVWMAADEEGSCSTRWWSGGAVGIQDAWEASSGWYDEDLDDRPPPDPGRPAPSPAAQSIALLAEAVRNGNFQAIKGLVGKRAAPLPRMRGPHMLAAFTAGCDTPHAFVACKSPGNRSGPHRSSGDWIIDAMGTRVAARGRGLGTKLAQHCIAAARAAGDAAEYRINVVPTAVGFWERLGFVNAEPSAEQQVFLHRGGDRPMVLPLSC